ncbi:MAG TPA: hypothetical protein VF907_03805 [Actinomycetota bacterium]
MSPTLRVAALIVVLALSATACIGSGEARTASICGDLRNLRATVSFLESPSAGTSVGEVRGDIEKLTSTVSAVEGSDAVPDPMGEAFSAARDDYRDLLDGIGDDDPFSKVAAEAAAPARRLGGAYDAVVEHLACDRTPSG